MLATLKLAETLATPSDELIEDGWTEADVRECGCSLITSSYVGSPLEDALICDGSPAAALPVTGRLGKLMAAA